MNFQPSPILKAYTSLTLAFPDPLALQAADILENRASNELLQAWLSGDLILASDSEKPSSKPVEQITDEMLASAVKSKPVTLSVPVPTQAPSAPLNQELPVLLPIKLPRMTVENGSLQPAAETEAAKAQEPGELPMAFKSGTGLINSPKLTKKMKQLASSRKIPLGTMLKQMGFANGAASLRSVLNKKGRDLDSVRRIFREPVRIGGDGMNAFASVVSRFAGEREQIEANYQAYKERREAESAALAAEIDSLMDRRRNRRRKFAQ